MRRVSASVYSQEKCNIESSYNYTSIMEECGIQWGVLNYIHMEIMCCTLRL